MSTLIPVVESCVCVSNCAPEEELYIRGTSSLSLIYLFHKLVHLMLPAFNLCPKPVHKSSFLLLKKCFRMFFPPLLLPVFHCALWIRGSSELYRTAYVYIIVASDLSKGSYQVPVYPSSRGVGSLRTSFLPTDLTSLSSGTMLYAYPWTFSNNFLCSL